MNRVTRRTLAAPFALLVLAAGVAACGGGGGSSAIPTPAAGTSPTPIPIPQHLYVGYKTDSLASLAIGEYALPLGPASVPSMFLPADGTRAAFAADASRGVVAVAFLQGSGESIGFYNAPFAPGETPFSVIAGGPATIPATTQFPIVGMSFDPGGDLWVATSSDLREFVPPFVSYAVPSNVVSNTVSAGPLANFTAQRAAFDPNGTMYVNDSTGALATTGVFSFAPPYTAPPKRANPSMTLGPLAFDGNGNVVTSFSFPALPTPGPIGTPLPQRGMGVFPLPLTSASAPNAIFNLPFSPPPNGQTDDAVSDGTSLYLANHGDGSLFVYALPLGAGAMPAMHIPCPAALPACGTPLGSIDLQLAP